MASVEKEGILTRPEPDLGYQLTSRNYFCTISVYLRHQANAIILRITI